MPENYSPASCELFVDNCNKTMSKEELLRAMIGIDELGCPVLKVKIIQEQANSLTMDFVQGATMANLVTAFNVWKAANPTKVIKMQSTFWDGTNHICNFFYK